MTKASPPVDPPSQDASVATPEILYNGGDTAAALEASCAPSTEAPSDTSLEYNRLLLSYLSSSPPPSSADKIVKQLDELEGSSRKGTKGTFHSRRNRRHIILTYNRSLIQFASGRPRDAAEPLVSMLKPIIVEKTSLRDNLVEPMSNVAFLILDCVLAVSEGRHDGLQQLDPTLTADSIVTWLDLLDFESRPRLKFLLALYKSRLDFAARDETGRMIDSKVRNVRKELKLRPAVTGNTSAETASVGSSSEVTPSDDLNIPSSFQQQQPVNYQEALSQALNRSALNLKANWEQLKGNAKKSLVLCAQARSSDPIYESVHANNLAVVYASCGKRHLALHSSAASLRSSDTPSFRLDGTATPNTTLSVLHNSALFAFQAQRFQVAYECMANCVMSSKEYAERPRCWLRMAESCIGIYARQKREKEEKLSQAPFVAVEKNGEPSGVLLKANFVATPPFAPQELVSALGSEMDMIQIVEQPLGRALMCLERVIRMNDYKPIDKDCLESARCSLAFLKLELRDHQGASDIAMSILLDDNEAFWHQVGGLPERVHKQRRACARLYASEAFAALGKIESAIQLISKENDSSFLNDLAVDLSGGISPDIDVNDVSRLVNATTVVKANASSVSASMGDLSEAEKLAGSALESSEQSENTPASSLASARKTLLYCMLQDGNREGALETLSSSSR